MGEREVQPDGPDGGHEKDAGALASRPLEPLDCGRAMRLALLPIQQFELDAVGLEELQYAMSKN